MTERTPISVDNKTRRLLLESNPKPSKANLEAEKEIRERSRVLLEEHGQPLLSHFGIEQIEKQIEQAANIGNVLNEAKGLRRLAQTFSLGRQLMEFSMGVAWAETQSKLDRVRDYIVGSPMRSVTVPFENQKLMVLSYQPEVVNNIKGALRDPDSYLATNTFTFDECYVHFGSTSWDNGLVVPPEGTTPSELAKQGMVVSPVNSIDYRRMRAVLDYTESYFKS